MQKIVGGLVIGGAIGAGTAGWIAIPFAIVLGFVGLMAVLPGRSGAELGVDAGDGGGDGGGGGD